MGANNAKGDNGEGEENNVQKENISKVENPLIRPPLLVNDSINDDKITVTVNNDKVIDNKINHNISILITNSHPQKSDKVQERVKSKEKSLRLSADKSNQREQNLASEKSNMVEVSTAQHSQKREENYQIKQTNALTYTTEKNEHNEVQAVIHTTPSHVSNAASQISYSRMSSATETTHRLNISQAKYILHTILDPPNGELECVASGFLSVDQYAIIGSYTASFLNAPHRDKWYMDGVMLAVLGKERWRFAWLNNMNTLAVKPNREQRRRLNQQRREYTAQLRERLMILSGALKEVNCLKRKTSLRSLLRCYKNTHEPSITDTNTTEDESDRDDDDDNTNTSDSNNAKKNRNNKVDAHATEWEGVNSITIREQVNDSKFESVNSQQVHQTVESKNKAVAMAGVEAIGIRQRYDRYSNNNNDDKDNTYSQKITNNAHTSVKANTTKSNNNDDDIDSSSVNISSMSVNHNKMNSNNNSKSKYTNNVYLTRLNNNVSYSFHCLMLLSSCMASVVLSSIPCDYFLPTMPIFDRRISFVERRVNELNERSFFVTMMERVKIINRYQENKRAKRDSSNSNNNNNNNNSNSNSISMSVSKSSNNTSSKVDKSVSAMYKETRKCKSSDQNDITNMETSKIVEQESSLVESKENIEQMPHSVSINNNNNNNHEFPQFTERSKQECQENKTIYTNQARYLASDSHDQHYKHINSNSTHLGNTTTRSTNNTAPVLRNDDELIASMRHLGLILTTACSSMILFVLFNLAEAIQIRKSFREDVKRAAERGISVAEIIGDHTSQFGKYVGNPTNSEEQWKHLVMVDEMSLTVYTRLLIKQYRSEHANKLQRLRNKFKNLLNYFETQIPYEEREEFDIVALIGNIIFKLMYLIGGGQRSIQADDRRVPIGSSFIPDDLEMSHMLEVPVLNRICWVACMMGMPIMTKYGTADQTRNNKPLTFAEADECVGVMRQLFQVVGALPSNSTCPVQFTEWLPLFPLYAVNTEGKRILMYLYSVHSNAIKPLALTIKKDMILLSFAEALKHSSLFSRSNINSYLFQPRLIVGNTDNDELLLEEEENYFSRQSRQGEVSEHTENKFLTFKLKTAEERNPLIGPVTTTNNTTFNSSSSMEKGVMHNVTLQRGSLDSGLLTPPLATNKSKAAEQRGNTSTNFNNNEKVSNDEKSNNENLGNSVKSSVSNASNSASSYSYLNCEPLPNADTDNTAAAAAAAVTIGTTTVTKSHNVIVSDSSSMESSVLFDEDVDIDVYTCLSIQNQLYLRCVNEATVRRHKTTELTPFVVTTLYNSTKSLMKHRPELGRRIRAHVPVLLSGEKLLVLRWTSGEPCVTLRVGDYLPVMVEKINRSSHVGRYFNECPAAPYSSSSASHHHHHHHHLHHHRPSSSSSVIVGNSNTGIDNNITSNSNNSASINTTNSENASNMSNNMLNHSAKANTSQLISLNVSNAMTGAHRFSANGENKEFGKTKNGAAHRSRRSQPTTIILEDNLGNESSEQNNNTNTGKIDSNDKNSDMTTNTSNNNVSSGGGCVSSSKVNIIVNDEAQEENVTSRENSNIEIEGESHTHSSENKKTDRVRRTSLGVSLKDVEKEMYVMRVNTTDSMQPRYGVRWSIMRIISTRQQRHRRRHEKPSLSSQRKSRSSEISSSGADEEESNVCEDVCFDSVTGEERDREVVLHVHSADLLTEDHLRIISIGHERATMSAFSFIGDREEVCWTNPHLLSAIVKNEQLHKTNATLIETKNDLDSNTVDATDNTDRKNNNDCNNYNNAPRSSIISASANPISPLSVVGPHSLSLMASTNAKSANANVNTVASPVTNTTPTSMTEKYDAASRPLCETESELHDIFYAIGVLLANTIANGVFLSIQFPPLLFSLLKRAITTGDYTFRNFTWLEPSDGNLLSPSAVINAAFAILNMSDSDYVEYLFGRGIREPEELIFSVVHSVESEDDELEKENAKDNELSYISNSYFMSTPAALNDDISMSNTCCNTSNSNNCTNDNINSNNINNKSSKDNTHLSRLLKRAKEYNKIIRKHNASGKMFGKQRSCDSTNFLKSKPVWEYLDINDKKDSKEGERLGDAKPEQYTFDTVSNNNDTCISKKVSKGKQDTGNAVRKLDVTITNNTEHKLHMRTLSQTSASELVNTADDADSLHGNVDKDDIKSKSWYGNESVFMNSDELAAYLSKLPSREEYISLYLVNELAWTNVKESGCGGQTKDLWVSLYKGFMTSPLTKSPLMTHCCSRVVREVLCIPPKEGGK